MPSPHGTCPRPWDGGVPNAQLERGSRGHVTAVNPRASGTLVIFVCPVFLVGGGFQ